MIRHDELRALPAVRLAAHAGDRALHAEQQLRGEREAAAEWVRANLPECSAFAAIVREQFSQARLCFASENGHTVGKPFVPAFVVSGDALVQEPMVARKGRSG